jgi:hypothetical protein
MTLATISQRNVAGFSSAASGVSHGLSLAEASLKAPPNLFTPVPGPDVSTNTVSTNQSTFRPGNPPNAYIPLLSPPTGPGVPVSSFVPKPALGVTDFSQKTSPPSSAHGPSLVLNHLLTKQTAGAGCILQNGAGCVFVKLNRNVTPISNDLTRKQNPVSMVSTNANASMSKLPRFYNNASFPAELDKSAPCNLFANRGTVIFNNPISTLSGSQSQTSPTVSTPREKPLILRRERVADLPPCPPTDLPPCPPLIPLKGIFNISYF